MMRRRRVKLHDHVEPAHPMVVRLYDDLLAIYTHIKENYQGEIDKAFDRVSRQIGYVITTTVPVTLEFDGKGALKGVSMGAEHLEGTIFEKELMESVSSLKKDTISVSKKGKYEIYLIWHEALKLKIKTDWLEPVHFRLETPYRITEEAIAVTPGVREPAHWLDPRLAISEKESVLITVIDEVYPELRLMDKIIFNREVDMIEAKWGINEPAHYRKLEVSPEFDKISRLISELNKTLKEIGYK